MCFCFLVLGMQIKMNEMCNINEDINSKINEIWNMEYLLFIAHNSKQINKNIQLEEQTSETWMDDIEIRDVSRRSMITGLHCIQFYIQLKFLFFFCTFDRSYYQQFATLIGTIQHYADFLFYLKKTFLFRMIDHFI